MRRPVRSAEAPRPSLGPNTTNVMRGDSEHPEIDEDPLLSISLKPAIAPVGPGALEAAHDDNSRVADGVTPVGYRPS